MDDAANAPTEGGEPGVAGGSGVGYRVPSAASQPRSRVVSARRSYVRSNEDNAKNNVRGGEGSAGDDDTDAAADGLQRDNNSNRRGRGREVDAAAAAAAAAAAGLPFVVPAVAAPPPPPTGGMAPGMHRHLAGGSPDMDNQDDDEVGLYKFNPVDP
jgi:hypothetical protein